MSIIYDIPDTSERLRSELENSSSPVFPQSMYPFSGPFLIFYIALHTNDTMDFLRRAGKSGAGAIVFDSTSDVHKFFFFFDKVSTASKTDEEKKVTFHWHIDYMKLDFCYENFAKG